MQTNQPKTWEDLKLSKPLINAALEFGFSHPTIIQARCIPLILAGQKVICIGQTGTGKTAAYLLPILSKLKYFQPTAPRALVLAPTKELVIQIANHARALAQFTDLKIVDLFGGVGPKQQIDLLEHGTDLIVSTPGRFLEIYLKGALKSRFIKMLVIDEADRMMDMNFMPQLRKIFEVLPSRRQDLLVSATYPPKVEKMTSEFIDFPVKVEVTPQSTASSLVEQLIYYTPNFNFKLRLLQHLFTNPEFNRVMIFARTKEAVKNLAQYLDRIKVGSIRVIHSNKGQNSRINALKEFKAGGVRILITTDVSARGIDVLKVSHVINFDVPVIYEDYVHRIGRTGRALETGVAITLVTPADVYHIAKIEKIIHEEILVSNLPDNIVTQETPYEESQKMAREIDKQKRREDPSFQGAFHERKR